MIKDYKKDYKKTTSAKDYKRLEKDDTRLQKAKD